SLQAVFEAAAAAVKLQECIAAEDYDKAIKGLAAALNQAGSRALTLADEAGGPQTPAERRERSEKWLKLERTIDKSIDAGQALAVAGKALYQAADKQKAIVDVSKQLVRDLGQALVGVLEAQLPKEAARTASDAYRKAVSFAPVAQSLIEGKTD